MDDTSLLQQGSYYVEEDDKANCDVTEVALYKDGLQEAWLLAGAEGFHQSVRLKAILQPGWCMAGEEQPGSKHNKVVQKEGLESAHHSVQERARTCEKC